MTQEQFRINEGLTDLVPPWRKWGPYVSERSWGTVREDYSDDGSAWTYFPFDLAHKKAYRWGEDGIAGWCDRYQVLVFAPAFWNEKDVILKERLFGTTPDEGNHGEDVKEYYYHLDGIPSHSYMKYLYKYPHAAFPYENLRQMGTKRGPNDPEFELADTGILNNNNYFDIFIEYAKASPEDTYIRIEAINRSDQSAPLHIIPQLWFRNQWSWSDKRLPSPIIKEHSATSLIADDTALASPANLNFDYHLGKRFLYGSQGGTPLFTNNEHREKDGFHRYIIHKDQTGIIPNKQGTKSALHYHFPAVPAKSSVVVYLRLTDQELEDPLKDIEKVFIARREEADSFYATVHPPQASEEEKRVQRQALAGMLWNKQIYLFDVSLWLRGDNSYDPPAKSRYKLRNYHWRHLNSMRILSMPDKWEYPWFAAWDSAFHVLSLALIDSEFAKEQIAYFLFDQFQHPNGAIPAYEWEYSDLNPPVQAWSILQLYYMQKQKTGVEDRHFLSKCFPRLLMNFAYWVNKVDSSGCNVFEGGFLGLDNIALFDRSTTLGQNSLLKQSDGTGWMAMFCLNMMRMALELAKHDHSYEGMATKFFQHFIHIANAMKTRDNKPYSLWSEEDGFFYDVLVYPNGEFSKFPIRSLVGLVPLYAIDILTQEELEQFPEFKLNFDWYLRNHPNKVQECVIATPIDGKTHYALTLVNEDHLQRILNYLLSPEEFLSSYGIRSLSKFHQNHPFLYKNMSISYEPAESLTNIKGGNSNWRGPVWFPLNYLLIQSLQTMSSVFKAKNGTTLATIDRSLADRLIALFIPDQSGVRPFFGSSFPFAKDPHFKDYLFFYEYFHGDTGQGLGASHQTGWTGLIANLIDQFRR